MKDEYVLNCPYCRGSEVIEACQRGYGEITAVGHVFRSVPLYHSVCRNCGSVIRSYVKEPEMLLKRKDRKSEF